MTRLHTYGQHFLRSPRVVAELIGHSNIRKNDIVYDLGAGSGVITSVLAMRCKAVVAVENEPGALLKLHMNVDAIPNVTVVESDLLKTQFPSEPYKIFSNIPFNLSSEVVRRYSESSMPPKALYLVTQKQFARKLVPGNDHFTSALGMQIGPLFSARIRKPLRKTDFTPPPAVDTVLLELKLRETPLLASEHIQAYRTFIASSFSSQPYFAEVIRRTQKMQSKRPSQLNLGEWVKLFESFRQTNTQA